jgi:predicted component of type VI protein secretion system
MLYYAGYPKTGTGAANTVGSSMPAQLVSLTDGPNILIDKPILLIGRHPECDIQIDSRKISRRHCCIAQVADYLVVRDLGSTNGIRINGARVLEGRLNENDELMISGLRYRVSWERLPISPQRPDRGVRVKAEPQCPPQPVSSDADDVLEACEEPVPLADPRSVRPGSAAEKHLLPRAGTVPPPENGAEASPPAARAEFRPSNIVPEDLHLTPASDPDGPNSRSS